MKPRKNWVKGNAVGSGSFGVVNLAMNNSTGELFVVKSAATRAGIQALKNEANILQNLNSPYIVQCLGREFSNEANGKRKLNLFMEFMAGGSLSDVAEKFGGSLHESVIRLYTREILKGLVYLHKNGIVHCDLKCKNVLLGSAGNVKLADFGCAKRLSSTKTENDGKTSWQKNICGTPLWMAPEVLRNEGLDFASDIWSLGCTIIEMATGRLPWGDMASNPMALVFKIACSNEIPEFPAKFSKEGLDFLEKCLQRNPKMRCSSEELLEHPFVLGSSARNENCEAACSPASTLDVGLFYESDGAESYEEEEDVTSRTSFSKWCSSQRRGLTTREKRECNKDLASSKDWITVRSD